jgi:transcriptional regulator with XRE-family HTH domain
MAKRHPVLTAFGLSVRKQREAHGLTQEALAEKADLDQTYISGIERGIRNPSVLSITRINGTAPQAFRRM